MKKLVLLWMIMGLFACQPQSRKDLIDQAPSLTRTFTDDLGRTLKVSRQPKRIISLAPNITEILFSLQLGDRFIARSQACNYPDAALDLPVVTTYPRLDLEQIQAQNPDLILATDEIFSRDDLAVLEKLNVPVYIQTYPSLDSLFDRIRDLGQLLNLADRANIVADSLQNLKNRIYRLTENQVHYSTIVLISDDPLMVAGGSGTINSMIEMSGGKNAMAFREEPFARTTVEEILKAQPEYLIIPSSDPRAYARLLTSYPLLSNTPADVHAQVFRVDPDLFFRPGPRLMEGMISLSGILHTALTPDKFEDEE